uniref:Transmembrane protein n=1 Tax=Heterorhabditis bacteriophora TaxID=37862 RepID=A0A1I7X8W0_HETBA
MMFTFFRQLLELVMSTDWTTYLAEYGQENGKYVRVKAATSAILLEKMIEFEKKSAGFFAINKGDRKKLLDTILRQLRILSSQSFSTKKIDFQNSLSEDKLAYNMHLWCYMEIFLKGLCVYLWLVLISITVPLGNTFPNFLGNAVRYFVFKFIRLFAAYKGLAKVSNHPPEGTSLANRKAV